MVLAFVVGPEQSRLVGLLSRPRIHHIIAKVKVFRHDNVQVFIEIFLGSECSLFQKSFYHCPSV